MNGPVGTIVNDMRTSSLEFTLGIAPAMPKFVRTIEPASACGGPNLSEPRTGLRPILTPFLSEPGNSLTPDKGGSLPWLKDYETLLSWTFYEKLGHT